MRKCNDEKVNKSIVSAKVMFLLEKEIIDRLTMAFEDTLKEVTKRPSGPFLKSDETDYFRELIRALDVYRFSHGTTEKQVYIGLYANAIFAGWKLCWGAHMEQPHGIKFPKLEE